MRSHKVLLPFYRLKELLSEEMHCRSIVHVPMLCAIPALMGADDAIEKYLVESRYWQNES